MNNVNGIGGAATTPPTQISNINPDLTTLNVGGNGFGGVGGIGNAGSGFGNFGTGTLNLSQKLTNSLQNSLVQSVSSSVAQSAINGDSFSESLQNSLRNLMINSIAELAANEIGTSYKTGEINKPTQLALHAGLGCGMALAGGNNCGAGSVAGITGELGAEFLDKNTGLGKTGVIEGAKIMSALASAAIVGPDDGGSVFAGSQIGRNAAENNYQKDVHKYLTQYLAENAGFTHEEAIEIARGNYRVDTRWDTQPLSIQIPYVFEPHKKYHFTTLERLQEMRRDAYEMGDLELFGQYLHAFQDSFSHQKDGVPYKPGVGHFNINEKELGAHVDRTYNRPELADQMAQETYQEMQDFLYYRNNDLIKNLFNIKNESISIDNVSIFNEFNDFYNSKPNIFNNWDSVRDNIYEFNRLKIDDNDEKGNFLFK